MLYKLVDLGSFYPDDEEVVRLILPGRPVEGLQKSAAQRDIDDFVTTMLKPETGKAYLHVNAMGAGEYYGSNKNGDYFPEEQLIKYHKTFEEHGYVYRHHVNHDPANSIGKVLFAVYNYDMHRVEVVEEVVIGKAQDIIDRLARGEYPATSMACKTPWDVCSICGNKAHTVKAYCQHLSKEMNKLHPDGRRTMALNLGPLKFFDMSVVLRPADVTSSVLRKVAAEGEPPSAVLGEEAGITDVEPREGVKQAALRKLADLIKEVPSSYTMAASSIDDVMKAVRPMPVDVVDHLLSLGGFNQVMNGLAELKMMPGLEFLAELVARVNGVPAGAGAGQRICVLLSTTPFSSLPSAAVDAVPEVYPEDANPWLLKALRDYQPGCGASQDCVEKRAYFPQAMAWGVMPLASSLYGGSQPLLPQEEGPGILDKLLALAGGAIVARFLLHSMVAEKNRLKSGYGNYQVKLASSSVENRILEASLRSDLSRLKHLR